MSEKKKFGFGDLVIAPAVGWSQDGDTSNLTISMVVSVEEKSDGRELRLLVLGGLRGILPGSDFGMNFRSGSRPFSERLSCKEDLVVEYDPEPEVSLYRAQKERWSALLGGEICPLCFPNDPIFLESILAARHFAAGGKLEDYTYFFERNKRVSWYSGGLESLAEIIDFYRLAK